MAQPFLHALVSCVRAPVTAMSGADGQIRTGGAAGVYALDTRWLSELVVSVDGAEPLAVGHRLVGRSQAEFVGAAMTVGDADIDDPTVRLVRSREVTASGLRETIRLINDGRRDVDAVVQLRLGCDLASVVDVKAGRASAAVPVATRRVDGHRVDLRWAAPSGGIEVTASVVLDGVVAGFGGVDASPVEPGGTFVVDATVAAPSRSTRVITVVIEADDPRSARWFGATEVKPPLAERLTVESGHPHLAALVRRSLLDLDSLCLDDWAGDTGSIDVFLAAGNPWFFTLFGRDSLWAARFALPLGAELAAGTLRALARRQATTSDGDTSAEPGKIIHEVRLEPTSWSARSLPTEYFGTVDATPLWVSLLHDAWCWGLDDSVVAELLDPMERAVGWILDQHRTTGFLAYCHEAEPGPTEGGVSDQGLTNQGWKDSGDSIQHGNGVLAEAPIVLCEVQAYAARALADAARLLDAFGRPGAREARGAAIDIAERFRASFWVTDGNRRYPAVAIDGTGAAVDSLTSNIGHLLGTGLLDAAEEADVAAWLVDDRLASGYGVRTMDAAHPRFNPLGYHSGSVWPHDTAVAVAGLVASGHPAAAARLALTLVDGAPTFDHRLPELLGGWPRHAGPPLAYPAACRPQAWSAAAAIVLLRAACGLDVDLPAGRVGVDPRPEFRAFFPLRVSGVRVGGAVIDIDIDADGRAAVTTDSSLEVVVGGHQ